jgi:GNAT superfamily N-acetyltransferase
MYRIREVDGDDDEIADTLHYLHKVTFGDSAPPIDPEDGWWWLVTYHKEPAAFAGLTINPERSRGYLCRVGVLPEYRGAGLQRKLILVRERKARKLLCSHMITDTTDNIASANTLIRAGYKLFKPDWLWAFPHSLYWRKDL